MILLLNSMVVLGLLVAPPPDPDVFGPLHIEPAREDAPALVVRRMGAVPLAALRLSVQVPPERGAAVAAGVLQELARERMERRAARSGARVRLELTATHATYEIVGQAAVFDELVGALREAVTSPPTDARLVARAWNRYRSRALVDFETPEPLVLRRLLERLYPELATTMSDADASRPGAGELERFWAAAYRPERMSAVIVGAVDLDAARSAFRDWSPRATEPRTEAAGDAPAGGTEAEPTRTDPQLLFAWAGLGLRSGEVDPAAAMLAARLLEHRLRAEGVDSPRADLWWSGARSALVVSGSARRTGGVPGREEAAEDAARLADLLRRTATQTAALLTPDEVAAARAEIQREVLMAARTPAGLARLIGTFLDRSGEAESALRFWNALAEASASDVRATMLALLSGSEVTVEVVP